MAPSMKLGDILSVLYIYPPVRTAVRPSVYLSVCPSRLGVRSISFEPLVGCTNNSTQV